MTFETAMLIEEMHETCQKMGVSDRAAAIVEQLIASDPEPSFARSVEKRGIDLAVRMKLALLEGAGIIDEDGQAGLED
jgi:hypothetical protein